MYCADGTHWDVEHKYATAYIKRLQQFLRHCDKINGTQCAGASVKNRAKAGNRQADGAAASTDEAAGASDQQADHRGRSANRAGAHGELMRQRTRSTSKKARQRKKKGTLVMRGCHEDEEEEESSARAIKYRHKPRPGAKPRHRPAAVESRDPASSTMAEF